MALVNLFLLPRTVICERLGSDPDSDAVLLRWMINSLIYLVLSLIVLWNAAT